MAIDPRNLRSSELVRLLNSTPLGEVISERQFYRHRSRAGFRIGDGKTVDLLRYVAWLVHERHKPKAEPDGDPYETLKDRARARNGRTITGSIAWSVVPWRHPCKGFLCPRCRNSSRNLNDRG